AVTGGMPTLDSSVPVGMTISAIPAFDSSPDFHRDELGRKDGCCAAARMVVMQHMCHPLLDQFAAGI
ncbi:MAG: hypothetical protein J4N66_11075, partial [Chloroflexi bacterium]|nr:hypothetical protein [Chloroflexota bacterium]